MIFMSARALHSPDADQRRLERTCENDQEVDDGNAVIVIFIMTKLTCVCLISTDSSSFNF